MLVWTRALLLLMVTLTVAPWPSTRAQDAPVAMGPGITFDLCPFVRAEQASQLLGQTVGSCQEAEPGADRQASYTAEADPEVRALFGVADYGAAEVAHQIYDDRRATNRGPDGTTSPADVVGVGEQGYIIPAAGRAELLIRQGPYLVSIVIVGAARPPSPVTLGLIATRIVAALPS
jgi:hypothetical protein